MTNEIRLIDGNALPYENQVLSQDDEWCLKVSDIEAAPTIAPESLRPKGRWEEKECGMLYACDQCGYLTDYQLSKFCPVCGAKMEE